jgi:hypothetical protein
MSTNNAFFLTFPDNAWKETTIHTFEGPFDSGVQHNIVLMIDPNVPKDISLKDYAKDQCESTATQLPGFEYVDQREKTMLSGTPVYEITYKYMPTDDVVLFQKQWYMVIKKKIYIFTSTFNKKTLNTIVNDIEEIIESLQMAEVVEE